MSVVASAAQVTLNLRSVSLGVAFAEIKKQTGFGFWYEKKDLLDLPKVSVSVRDVELRAALEACLKGQPLSYEIFDKTVVLKRKSVSPAVVPSKRSKQDKVRGKVVDAESKEPLAGVLVKVKSPEMSVVTNDKGEFELNLPNGKYELLVQYLSYNIREFSVTVPTTELLSLELTANENKLNQVEIVNTGYQSLPKERATGSFTVIDEKTLNRSVYPDLLSRLKGVTNSLLFDGNVGNTTGISVRGRSTIFSNTMPLIVVDNFPFEGDLNTINPDVIESVTVLKDAAAASIWGVRAGNGVLVITTKKGKIGAKPSIVLNLNTTISQKPDLYYQPQLNSSEYIDVEKFLFDKGAYNATINNGYGAISPVVAVLQKIKVDPSFTGQGYQQIDALRGIDNRKQIGDYFYRNARLEHYTAEVSGGGKNQSYYFSAGYDKNLSNQVSSSNDRFILKGNNNYSLLSDRLVLSTDIAFSRSTSNNSFLGGYSPFVPYEELADANDVPNVTVRRGGLRTSYIETAGNGHLLDWTYRPLEELRNGGASYLSALTDYRLNLGVSYKLLEELTLTGSYQYYNVNSKAENIYDRDSYYVRNMVNTYTNINPTTGVVARPVPYGGIYNPTFGSRLSNYGRIQASYDRNINDDHQITAVGGYEIRDDGSKQNYYTAYGYRPETGSSAIVDVINQFPYFYNPALSGRIVAATGQSASTNRYISFYGNASYIFDNRYILSASFRKDESNLFGVKANQKGVPLWSAGAAWNVNEERFFSVDLFSKLQLKATYGYSGNVNNSISAYLTASPSFYNPYGVQGSNIVNPPNDDLRWERVKSVNLALNFSLRNNLINGSIEYYMKNGLDLIGTSPISPQTGVSVFTGNTADTHTRGWDIQLNATPIDQRIKWNATFIFNYVRDRITDYKMTAGTNSSIVTATNYNLSPMVGYPINAIFAYRWAGLNASGSPKGYLNNQESIDYAPMMNSTDRSPLQFFGSATPNVFGGFRNTIFFKGIELSFNITYKLGYYFRRQSLNNASIFSGTFAQADYGKRWQNPGDELTTDVPALIYPNVANRSDFYNFSAVLIEKGDHVRLQDIQLSYGLNRKNGSKMPFKKINVYAYTNNIGILWSANRHGIDPDAITGFPSPLSLAIGLKTDF